MNINHVFLCAISSFKKWTIDIKIYTLLILILVFNLWNYSGVSEYAKIVGYGVSPWLFPHILITPVMMPIYGCFAMLLFCDAPFIDRHVPFVVVRTGRLSWVLGQIIYLVLTSFIYSIIIYLISVLVFLPNIVLTGDWGKVIRTLAINPASAYEKGIQLTVTLSNSIVASFSAIEATLLSLGLFFLVTLFTGIVIFSLNLIIGKMCGLITAGVLIFISYFVIFVGRLTIGLKVYYFSPLSWISLQYIDWYGSGDSPSLHFAVTLLLTLSMVLCILSVIVFLKKDIDIDEGAE